jgi:hypothetical protein
MPKPKFNVTKLSDSAKHQAVCTTDSFAGPRRDTEDEAEDDAAGHKAKPGCQNHIVNIVTVEQRVRAFKAKK